ncbi:MAG TPA: hypothetical protein DDY70_01545 [Clostridiales bacterium]|nr:hypothetical protein [Clostridiales bacterium]
MRKIRLLSLVMALCLVAVMLVSCGPKRQEIDLNDAIEHDDFTSVYDMIGSKVTIDMVTENEDGTASVTVEGKTYTLGMDFLSMAMVYNCTVPKDNEKYKTEEDVYNEWWKLYIQRWNLLVPEIPLYSNQYFDLYNAKITGFVTTPYWGPEDAIVAARVDTSKGSNSVILGSSTDLSGLFRNSSWGKSSPGSADLDIENLTTGYSTVMTNKEGTYIWNTSALNGTPVKTLNDDGTLTYTIKIKEGMKFSDGSVITAKNYIIGTLSNSTAVAVAAGGTGKAGNTLVGYDTFSKYTGEGDTVYFKGIKLLDDYTFAVTILADYANYYYSIAYAAFSPAPMKLYADTAEIVVNADKECGLSAAYYATEKKDGKDVYTVAEKINGYMRDTNAANIPFSGPYIVSNWDSTTLTATLKLNPYYTGDDARGTAAIETISYVKIVEDTQTDQFKTGQVDILAGITGGDATKAALKIVQDAPDKFAETHYDRAGYGKLGFRCDFGPTSFASVRQAIMYTIDRNDFAQTFTGGYGSVVHGPYYTGYSAYKAVADDIILNNYTYSTDKAVAALVADGWIYNENGEEFNPEKDEVRYKKLSGYELSKDNLGFKTTDNKYATVKIDGSYYMPLAINYYGTQPNSVTDQLISVWSSNTTMQKAIGMYIVYTSTGFNEGLYGELYRMESYGYDGTPKVNAINFATGFTSAAYDFSFNWSISPDYYDDYNGAAMRDEADFYSNYN